MKKLTISLLAGAMLTSTAFAGSKGGCTGTYRGNKIVFKGFIANVLNKDSGSGAISVNGRRVADFDGEDLKINYIFRSFKARNNQGSLVEGKVHNLSQMTGTMKRLYVPGFGIDYRNVPMTCWSN